MLALSITSIPDTRFINLAWETFFRSRNRGISMEKHFPWAMEATPGYWYVLAQDEARAIGGLVVKRSVFTQPGHGDVTIGAVGLVCVDPAHRGTGIAGRMLDAAIREAILNQYDALTLWTGQPHVYASKGFATADNGLYGWVRMDPLVHTKYESKITKEFLPTGTGLPPFAIDSAIYTDGVASVTIVYDREGPIVAHYSGQTSRLVDLLGRLLPGSWRLNTRVDDPLVSQLEKAGATLDLNGSSLQMWKRLQTHHDIGYLQAIAPYSVLDRI